MVLIRVALVGLAADASPQVRAGNWGVVAHLKPLLASPHYELVAVCNSSVESAQKSIDFHGLDASKVKAYGSTKDLAKDPNVDLISVSINVVKHAEATQPLLEAGRNVVVEWPLGTNLEEAEGLTKTAKEKGVRSVVGLQFRADPLLKKVKQMVADGIIGDTRSSVALGCSSILPGDIWIEGGTYFIDMNTGGNEFTILFGHFLDAFTHVLGDFTSTKSILKNNHPTVPLINPATGEVTNPNYPKNTPDHIFVQGELASGALASISFRKVAKPVDELGLRWLISGTKGEIEVTMPEGHVQQSPMGRTIRLRSGKEGEAQVVPWEDTSEGEHITGVPQVGENTARMYEDYATGGNGLMDFEGATRTHRLLNQILKESGYKY